MCQPFGTVGSTTMSQNITKEPGIRRLGTAGCGLELFVRGVSAGRKPSLHMLRAGGWKVKLQILGWNGVGFIPGLQRLSISVLRLVHHILHQSLVYLHVCLNVGTAGGVSSPQRMLKTPLSAYGASEPI